ncbi:GH116 family glycosyl-hydrolase [uncultured Maribacter sp.]|uniref:GH116 family glycosyl-hydrolase n=1 Tax=uncultured Maribacter sp. TaxID=431308 RepID=UPI00260342B2|nr:GH116 family glycosyl-hydrolase [uncultured Maribacter sp.]
MNKNTFVIITIIGVLLSACTEYQPPVINKEKILAELSLSSNGKTEVVKNFPKNFPEVLIDRGNPTVYTRENSNNFEYIGMPVGGIGAGQLYLGGDGQLWFWDIFSLNHEMGQLKGEEAYQYPYERSKPNEKGARMIHQGFSITAKFQGKQITKKLNREGFKNIEFIGQYPVGEVNYKDDDLPVAVKMEAYSPFVPLDLDNSILPATVFDFEISNTSNQEIEVDLNAWMENAVLVDSKSKNKNLAGELVNKVVDITKNEKRIIYSAKNVNDTIKNALDFGSMSLTLLSKEGTITSTEKNQTQKLSDSLALVGKLSNTILIKPKTTHKATAILTWYFPKTLAALNKWKGQSWAAQDHGHPGADTTRYYARLFSNANKVASYVSENYNELSGNTKKWHKTWYNSTLPYWFLDRTFLNTSILASSTISLVGDRLYYGSEGGNQGPGTCTHVYGYTQAPGRLFPNLEKSIREQVDYVPISEGGALKENGEVHFRWFNMGMAVDGQSGIIMKSYQLHQVSSDDSFLKKNYASIKKIMNGLIDHNDADHDGILTGPQHNTLDAAWYGKVTWLSLYYTTALRAMSEMAKEVGDNEYAEFCLATADKGRNYVEEHLFNGEYFIHEADSLHLDSPGTYTGLEYSQLLGQSWAYQVGLGEVLDYDKAKTALESMWRYNFTTDVDAFRKAHPTGRWYAMPGEGGIIACTWPRGGSEALEKGDPRFAAYNNECQNGYEYAATSLMMRHGMPYHSLAHIWYMDQNRYHGSKRNPYCEIEWGLHYARSMASYGHFISVSGFEYHGPKGYISFAPQITPHDFKSAYTSSEGWGTFEQKQTYDSQTNKIAVSYGKLQLKTLMLETHIKIDDIDIKIDGNTPKFTYEKDGLRLKIQFEKYQTISATKTMIIEIDS